MGFCQVTKKEIWGKKNSGSDFLYYLFRKERKKVMRIAGKLIRKCFKNFALPPDKFP
jgi:hypothetical protein